MSNTRTELKIKVYDGRRTYTLLQDHQSYSLVGQEEAAGEAVPLLTHAHAHWPAVGYRVDGRVFGDAVELGIQIQGSVITCKHITTMTIRTKKHKQHEQCEVTSSLSY